ncbi:adenosylcobinamide-GDP ribazoletransferase [Opitutaceae bacterium EW11]|nr:adenosylcobinamide-GDP ribazoletransferase [Opitutaceae bacterium EW11]
MSGVARELRAFWHAVMFFTRLPVPASATWDPADLQRSSAYFPLVGWLVGGVGALAWVLGSLVWPPLVASGISLAATVLCTGAFHEDAIADVCDGFGGGYTKDRVLEIMRDSRVGAFGAIGAVIVIGLKWQSVAALPPFCAPALIVAGHAVSRGAAISLQASLSYVRQDASKSKPLAIDLRGGRLAAAMAFAVLPMALLPWRYLWALLPVLLVRSVLVRWYRQRIGGYTGDCLGAAQQVSELAFYLSAIAIVSLTR